eukprot:CAMPEP_0117446274 /NCGR_PEP_ID=MMETSP0759-20121206/6249_1 /TAXON_ID=63605 /ORGANISM="Percolomonas cosmopolitus, Strain WS" /LENGTH=154 /DNA_ID=CAMNT_0005238521 /DNA_START=202 /DNA_END=664 /DNA_ORIENTATION=-
MDFRQHHFSQRCCCHCSPALLTWRNPSWFNSDALSLACKNSAHSCSRLTCQSFYPPSTFDSEPPTIPLTIAGKKQNMHVNAMVQLQRYHQANLLMRRKEGFDERAYLSRVKRQQRGGKRNENAKRTNVTGFLDDDDFWEIPQVQNALGMNPREN